MVESLKEIFKISSDGGSDKPYCYIAQALSTVPPWFRNVIMGDKTLVVHTSASPLAFLQALYSGSEGVYRPLTDYIYAYHYKADKTLYHEIAHRCDHILAHKGYMPYPCFGVASSGHDEWKSAVYELGYAGRMGNSIHRHLRLNFYKPESWAAEAFAEITAEYVMAYRTRGEAAKDYMRQTQPELWPLYEKEFLPRLEAYGRDLGQSFDDVLRTRPWSVVDIMRRKDGVSEPYLRLEVSDMTRQQLRIFAERLDRFGTGAMRWQYALDDKAVLIPRQVAGELMRHMAALGCEGAAAPDAKRPGSLTPPCAGACT